MKKFFILIFLFLSFSCFSCNSSSCCEEDFYPPHDWGSNDTWEEEISTIPPFGIIIDFQGCDDGKIYYWVGVSPVDSSKPLYEGIWDTTGVSDDIGGDKSKWLFLEKEVLCSWEKPSIAVNCTDFRNGEKEIEVKQVEIMWISGKRTPTIWVEDKKFYDFEDSEYGWGKVLIIFPEMEKYCN